MKRLVLSILFLVLSTGFVFANDYTVETKTISAINYAIREASDSGGGSVWLSGTYPSTENIVMRSNVTLIGYNAKINCERTSGSVIQGSNVKNVKILGIEIDGNMEWAGEWDSNKDYYEGQYISYTAISGMEDVYRALADNYNKNPSTGYWQKGSSMNGIYIYGTSGNSLMCDVLIRDVTIKNIPAYGMVLRNGTNVRVEDSDFSYCGSASICFFNEIHNGKVTGNNCFQSYKGGIKGSNGSGNIISHNTIKNDKITTCIADGITYYPKGNKDNVISYNIISGINDHHGIHVGGEGVVVSGNIISNCGRSHWATVNNKNTKPCGIYLDTNNDFTPIEKTTVFGNIIDNAFCDGIRLNNGKNITGFGNVVTNCEYGLRLFDTRGDSCSDVQFFSNDLGGNLHGKVLNSSSGRNVEIYNND